MPRVSIIIPTYNRKDYVQEAIDSVLVQTYTDYEIIVIDDGSTDGTGEALAARYGDRIRYTWQENQGESVARNRGIELATGEYVALLDSDDLWLPEKLAKQVSVLESPGVVLVFVSSWLMDGNGQRLNDPPLCSGVHENDLTLDSLCLSNAMGNAGSTALIRYEALHRVGGFDPTIQYGEDWDLWLRLRRQGFFAFIEEPLACIRRHTGSQWHYHRPETVDKRLVDHLRMLEKTFANWPGDVPQGLRERSLARHYGLVAFLDYAIGRAELGQQRLSKAMELDPEHWSDPKLLSELLVNNSLAMALLPNRPVQKTASNVVATFDHWPSELSLSDTWKAHVLSEVYAGVGFASYKAHDFSKTRYCLMRAIRYDPSWLRNRGVWSVGVEAFLGKRLTGWLRRSVRSICRG